MRSASGGWAREGGGVETDFGRSVAVDASGNVFVTGSFTGAAEFSGVAITSTDDAEDIFLAKYAPDGTLLWIRSGGGPNIDFPGKVAVDEQGNAYITGTHFRPAVFGGISLANAANQPNAFVVKYGPEGDVVWAITMGGDGWDSGDAIAVEPNSGRVIVGGQFEGTAQFGILSATAVSQRDLYLTGLDTEGAVVLLSVLGQVTGNEQLRGLTSTPDGSIYAACSMDGSVTIGTTYVSAGGQDCMLLKFGPDDGLEWARFGGGIADDLWNDVAVAADGGVFVCGIASLTAEFGTETIVGAGDKDEVLAKYGPEGELEWVQHGGGAGIDAGGGVVALSDGHTLLAGTFQGTATFGGSTVTAGAGSDVLLVECDALGAAVQLTHWGMGGDNSGYGVARSVSGAVYMTGQFEGSMVIGDTALQSSGGREAFVHQVCDGSVALPPDANVPGVLVTPSPVQSGLPFWMSVGAAELPLSITIMDALGRVLGGSVVNTERSEQATDRMMPGLYVLRAVTGKGIIRTQRLVLE